MKKPNMTEWDNPPKMEPMYKSLTRYKSKLQKRREKLQEQKDLVILKEIAKIWAQIDKNTKIAQKRIIDLNKL